MALPMILGLLGSGLAGAGALSSLGVLASPLIAGAVGSGLGSAIETGDLKEGIKTGLTAGALGALGGAVVGGGSGLLPPAGAAGTAGVGATSAAGAAGTGQAAQTGIRGALAQMPRGIAPVTSSMPGTFTGAVQQGLNQGVLTGAGIGAAVPGTVQAMFPRPEGFEMPEREYIPEAAPANRRRYVPSLNYRPGYDPEQLYFDPNPMPSMNFAQGGMVRYQPMGMQPVYMQAGGIADMAPGAEMVEQEDGMEDYAEDMREMNDKDIVQNAIRAIKGELGEQQAAMVLGRFLQQFGEDALRRLVSDVRTGKADGDRGDVEGMVEGPGDGMDDFVPAEMDDGSQDVLLSDGEFVVPADVVSGLGNGSTDAGAEELYNMMDRVREERTGMTEQPDQIRVGGLLPA